jgi:glycine/D-amino acid oxidase-like deaminating enzyme
MAPELAKHGSVYLSNSGTIYPRKLVHHLFSAAQDRMPGLSIHTFNPVTAVDLDASTDSKHPYRTTTERGVIRSRAVFHATNAYCNRLIPELRSASTGVFGCRAHMLAVQPNIAPPAGKDTTMAQGYGYDDFWHWILQRPQNGPFLYGHAEVESQGDYDDSVTLAVDHPIRSTMLRFLETAFPHKFKDLDAGTAIVADWTGIQGFTSDGSSIVGRPRKDSPAEWCSVGHNGEGMTRCFLAASVATEAMLAQMKGESWKVPDWFPHSYRRDLEVGQ